MRGLYRARLAAVAVAALAVLSGGCTSLNEYLHNGFKVGPDYCPPQTPVARHWIDQSDLRVEPNPEILSRWWTVFNDAKLNELVWCAYQQNLTLKEAGCRVLQARALRAIAAGNLFPQFQDAAGGYARVGAAWNPSAAPLPIAGRFFDQWNYDFNLSWELDFWGRFRRAVAAADATLEASYFGYDAVLVTLLGDVAQTYVQLRTDQARIKLLQANIELQRGVLQFIDTQYKAGFRQTRLDLEQAISNLKQTEAQILPLEIDLRQREDQLCILLGMPPVALENMLGIEPIPVAPPEVVLGIPAELLRRRPDVRRAERLAAAQAEEIGIAQADLYPAFFINGSLGYTARNFPDLFKQMAFNGSVGPSFQWNLLNYGRIVNHVRYQDARFQELVFAYQNTVLQANREVEDGLVTFLRSQRQTKLLDESVTAAKNAVELVVLQYQKGAVDFNRYAVIEQNLVTQQDLDAQARGQIAQGLVAMYRALGGGWEIRLGAMGPEPAAPVNAAARPEPVPAPMPNIPKPAEAPPAAPQ